MPVFSKETTATTSLKVTVLTPSIAATGIRFTALGAAMAVRKS